MIKQISAIITIIIILSFQPLFAATYYIDYVSGADTNNGTAKETPWKHAPGMTGCAGNCASYQTAHPTPGATDGAGDQFILKGGVTWPNAALAWDWIYGSGTEADPIYFGVDATWYTGDAWYRPVLDSEDSAPNPSAYIKTMVRFYAPVAGWFVVDNLEFTGYPQLNNDDPLIPQMLSIADASEVKNCYFHGWSHGGNATQDNMIIIGTSLISEGPDLNARIHHNVFDGSDTDKDMAMAYKGSAGHIYNNYFGNMQNAIVAARLKYVWGNTFENIAVNDDFDLTQHHQSYEENGGQTIFYNNYIKNSGGGGTVMTYGMDNLKDYIFNNVIITDVNQSIQIGTKNSSTITLVTGEGYEIHVFNNTIQTTEGENDYPIAGPGLTDAALIPLMAVRNNHLIGDTHAVSFGAGVAEDGDVESNTLGQTNSQATTANYLSTSTYPYYPPAGGATIDAGYDMSAVCAEMTDNGTSRPSVACLSDTTLGVAYDAINHRVTGDGRTAVLRGSTWDIGAYEYSGGAPPTTNTTRASGAFNLR